MEETVALNIKNQPTQSNIIEPQQIDNDDMLVKIKALKLSLLDRVASTIETQGDYLEPRDLKQLNDLVLSIESSIIKGPSETGGINVLIQNLLQEYKSDV